MKRLHKPLLSLLVGVALGCGIGPHIDDYNESLVATALASCACGGHAVLQFASEEECRAKAPPSASEQACIEALFKNVSGEFEVHLDCRTAANNRYASCLNSRTCTDLARAQCFLDWLDEIEDCPKFPAELEKDHNECLN